jgi:predicted negative regulator of RcsB-dependent stress response
MAKMRTESRRKLVEFDEQTWHALNLLSREAGKTFQQLADEAFGDLLQKQGRPTDLKEALRESAKSSGKRRPRASR